MKDKKRQTWGWKEPNTQIYLDELVKFFPSLKYIHIVRHGLDMAFSKNKQQLENWGYRYGIVLNGDETEEELAYKQMEYWCRSTKDAMKVEELLGERFLFINHSLFCEHSQEQVERLVKFLGLELSNEKLSQLVKIPRVPSTQNRFKMFDVGIFDKWHLEYVEELGFEI